MMRVVVEVPGGGAALAWVTRAQQAGLIPDDVGLRIDGDDLVVDRRPGPGPWMRPPAEHVSF